MPNPTWEDTAAVETPAWEDTTPEQAAPVLDPAAALERGIRTQLGIAGQMQGMITSPAAALASGAGQAQISAEEEELARQVQRRAPRIRPLVLNPETGALEVAPRTSAVERAAARQLPRIAPPYRQVAPPADILNESVLGPPTLIRAPVTGPEGAYNVTAETLRGLTSPAMIATAPAFEVPAVRPLLSAGVSALGTKAAAEALGRLSGIPQPTTAERVGALEEAGTGALMAAIPAAGEFLALRKRLPRPAPRVLPPPDVLGRFLPTPPGSPAPRIEPPTIEMASPEAAAASARAMQRRATAAYEPPRLAPPQVPEGPLEPPTVTPEPPPAPPELATWDDFVAHLSRNGTGLETRNQIRAMFADVVPGMSSEAAAKLARDAFGAEWMPGGRPPQAPARAEPPTAPVAPPAPPAPTPPTPGRLEWMGKPLEEWEKMTSSANLPKGGARVRLARSLGLAEGQDTPARILAAIKKRTGEIRAAAATKPPPPPPEAPGAAPVPVPTPPKPPAAPAAAAEKVTLYTGKGGVGGAGEGGSWFTGNLEKARSYGPDVRAVEVPREVADQAKKAAQQQGQGGDTYFLTREHADKAQPIAAPPAKVTEIPTEETTAAESFAKETGWTFSPSAAVMPTPEELAALSPEKRAQFQAIHQANGWEFTDRRPDSPTKGMTFYTKIGATPEEIRAAYAAHLAKNAPKATAPPAVRPPAGELFAVPEGPRTGPAARSYIVRRLEELEDVDPVTGEAFPKEDLTEAQEKARKRFRAMLADIEAQAKAPRPSPGNIASAKEDLLQEGVTADNAEALLSGKKTPEQVVQEQLGIKRSHGTFDSPHLVIDELPNGTRSAMVTPEAGPARMAERNIGQMTHEVALSMAHDQGVERIQSVLERNQIIPKRPTHEEEFKRIEQEQDRIEATRTAPAAPKATKPGPPVQPPATRPQIIAEGQKRQKTSVHVTAPPATPPPGASFFAAPAQNPLGPAPPSAIAMARVFSEFWKPLSELGEAVRVRWRAFANQSVPRLTAANRETGEAAARLEAAPRAGADMGDLFADKVMEGVKEPLADGKWGTAVTEDNLRDLKRQFQDRADEAADPETYLSDLRDQLSELKEATDKEDVEGQRAIRAIQRDIDRIKAYTPEDAVRFQELADNVRTMIGSQGSPFPTEESYQAFLASPEVQNIIIPRHRQLWREQKDPVYRMANDLDPDLPLETRGAQTGARINLKAVLPGEKPTFPVGGTGGGPLIRQARTFLRRDPFGRPATGAAPVYEGSYRELMRNGFAREYPVAAQHDFIKHLVESGNAVTSGREFEPDLKIKGEPTKAYELKLRPWTDRPTRVWLHVRESLAREYQRVTGLEKGTRLPLYSTTSEFFTKQSVMALAEGTTHSVNLFTRLLRMGPTANPLINALIDVGKSTAAGGLPVDLLYTIPRVLIRGFTKQREAMLELTKISATKRPYRGGLGMGWLLNRFDQGIRLVAAENYRAMAKAKRVPDTETGLREYVNQAGQYSKAMQPTFLAFLRSTGIQPFATAVHTFNIQALRQGILSPGAKASSAKWALAMRVEQAAKFAAFLVLLRTIQGWLTPGSAAPPKGTPLGAVGWIDPKDQKLHTFDLGGLYGYTRLFNMTGIGPYMQARRMGLPTSTAVQQGLRSAESAGLRYLTGPLNQAGSIAITGSRPGVPMVREAPVVPPQQQDSLDPLKWQAAKNVETALIRANPWVSTYSDIKEGKTWEEIRRRQLLRFTPRTGPSAELIEAMPKVAETREMRDYTDYLATQARKLPIDKRADFIIKRLETDGVTDENWRQAWQMIRRKGVLRYE